jgi:uncharacterized membrane protein YedE/YeeE
MLVVSLVVSSTGFWLVRQRTRPVLTSRFLWPTRSDIDGQLVVGSVLFGAGAGIVGVCPGAILINLSTLAPGALALVAAMAAGMIIKDLWDRLKSSGITVRGDPLSVKTDG